MSPDTVVEECVAFTSEGLRLEGVLAYLESQPVPHSAVLLLCPHPHLGGNMDNNVVRHLARRAAEDGCVTLRFNYRGVGNSELVLPDGLSLYAYWEDMEREHRYEVLLPDALAAAEFLIQASGVQRWSIVGYSLGALLAGMVARHARPDRIVAISPPVRKVPLPPDYGDGVPKTFVFGDADFTLDPEAFRRDYDLLQEPKSFLCLSGMDHFFRKFEERLYLSIRVP